MPDEHDRLVLYRKLEELLGSDPAATLMASLPPMDWSHVATKHDLASLEAGLRAEFRADLATSSRSLLVNLIVVMVALHTLTIALLAFLR